MRRLRLQLAAGLLLGFLAALAIWTIVPRAAVAEGEVSDNVAGSLIRFAGVLVAPGACPTGMWRVRHSTTGQELSFQVDLSTRFVPSSMRCQDFVPGGSIEVQYQVRGTPPPGVPPLVVATLVIRHPVPTAAPRQTLSFRDCVARSHKSELRGRVGVRHRHERRYHGHEDR